MTEKKTQTAQQNNRPKNDQTSREHKPGRSKRSALKLYIGMVVLTVLLNGISRYSTVFCDKYVTYIFPLWVNTYGRLTGIFPFSVGEMLILAGLKVLSGAVWGGILAAVCRLRHKKVPGWVKIYLKFFAWVLVVVCLIMTLNCFLLYHVSTFAEMYLADRPGVADQSGMADEEGMTQTSENYSLEDFLRMRNRIAARCNELSARVTHEGNGYVMYLGSVSETGEKIDMQDKAREAMQRLGETYPRLQGFYPRPKPLYFSDLMCQQYSLGWYFPFSMEANYNKVAYVTSLPATMCHELAHLKGFIYEDEANFIGYLACVQSGDEFFEYSGYLSVLGYLEQDLQKAAKADPEGYAAAVEAQGVVELLDEVYQDDIFVTEEEWERIEQSSFLKTKTVSKITDMFVDTTLKVNGVADGKISYSRVVQLMMQYEYGVKKDRY